MKALLCLQSFVINYACKHGDANEKGAQFENDYCKFSSREKAGMAGQSLYIYGVKRGGFATRWVFLLTASDHMKF